MGGTLADIFKGGQALPTGDTAPPSTLDEIAGAGLKGAISGAGAGLSKSSSGGGGGSPIPGPGPAPTPVDASFFAPINYGASPTSMLYGGGR